MKKIFFVLFFIAGGMAIGFAWSFVQLQATSARTFFSPEELEKHHPSGPEVDDPDQFVPKAVVDNETFDFGVMDKSGRSSHEFTVTNEGTAPLTLVKGNSSCKCTMAMIDRHSVLPGKSTKIEVEWTARDYLGPFEQIASLETNDPKRPKIELKIKGWTTAKLEFVPDELILGRIASGRPATAKVKLFAHTNELVKILSAECAEPETAEFFEVNYTPLSPEELASETNVKCGYAITVNLKPGLPQRPFQQTIRFQTSSPDAKMVELPVRGQIESDISIIGPGWNKKRDLLDIGLVDGSRGAKRTLRLVTHGLHRKDIEFKVAEVWPKGILRARLGKTTEINQGNTTQTPLEIEIPKGAGPANHLASGQGNPGRIVLECNYPSVPKIIILVNFAIEGG